jgi:hypothetical protein
MTPRPNPSPAPATARAELLARVYGQIIAWRRERLAQQGEAKQADSSPQPISISPQAGQTAAASG